MNKIQPESRMNRRKPDFYRYFLGVRPNAALCAWLAAIGQAVGQRVNEARLHLTLCVIVQTLVRDHFIMPRVAAALAEQTLDRFQIRLGRMRGGASGAFLASIGRQDSIQDFYDELIRLLALCGIAPLFRKAGLNAHITLGHDACRFTPFNAPLVWMPDELLLIESEFGLTRHNVLGRWPLLPPRQGLLPFDEPAAAWRLAS